MQTAVKIIDTLRDGDTGAVQLFLDSLDTDTVHVLLEVLEDALRQEARNAPSPLSGPSLLKALLLSTNTAFLALDLLLQLFTSRSLLPGRLSLSCISEVRLSSCRPAPSRPTDCPGMDALTQNLEQTLGPLLTPPSAPCHKTPWADQSFLLLFDLLPPLLLLLHTHQRPPVFPSRLLQKILSALWPPSLLLPLLSLFHELPPALLPSPSPSFSLYKKIKETSPSLASSDYPGLLRHLIVLLDSSSPRSCPKWPQLIRHTYRQIPPDSYGSSALVLSHSLLQHPACLPKLLSTLESLLHEPMPLDSPSLAWYDLRLLLLLRRSHYSPGLSRLVSQGLMGNTNPIMDKIPRLFLLLLLKLALEPVGDKDIILNPPHPSETGSSTNFLAPVVEKKAYGELPIAMRLVILEIITWGGLRGGASAEASSQTAFELLSLCMDWLTAPDKAVAGSGPLKPPFPAPATSDIKDFSMLALSTIYGYVPASRQQVLSSLLRGVLSASCPTSHRLVYSQALAEICVDWPQTLSLHSSLFSNLIPHLPTLPSAITSPLLPPFCSLPDLLPSLISSCRKCLLQPSKHEFCLSLLNALLLRPPLHPSTAVLVHSLLPLPLPLPFRSALYHSITTNATTDPLALESLYEPLHTRLLHKFYYPSHPPTFLPLSCYEDYPGASTPTPRDNFPMLLRACLALSDPPVATYLPYLILGFYPSPPPPSPPPFLLSILKFFRCGCPLEGGRGEEGWGEGGPAVCKNLPYDCYLELLKSLLLVILDTLLSIDVDIVGEEEVVRQAVVEVARLVGRIDLLMEDGSNVLMGLQSHSCKRFLKVLMSSEQQGRAAADQCPTCRRVGKRDGMRCLRRCMGGVKSLDREEGMVGVLIEFFRHLGEGGGGGFGCVCWCGALDSHVDVSKAVMEKKRGRNHRTLSLDFLDHVGSKLKRDLAASSSIRPQGKEEEEEEVTEDEGEGASIEEVELLKMDVLESLCSALEKKGKENTTTSTRLLETIVQDLEVGLVEGMATGLVSAYLDVAWALVKGREGSKSSDLAQRLLRLLCQYKISQCGIVKRVIRLVLAMGPEQEQLQMIGTLVQQAVKFDGTEQQEEEDEEENQGNLQFASWQCWQAVVTEMLNKWEGVLGQYYHYTSEELREIIAGIQSLMAMQHRSVPWGVKGKVAGVLCKLYNAVIRAASKLKWEGGGGGEEAGVLLALVRAGGPAVHEWVAEERRRGEDEGLNRRFPALLFAVERADMSLRRILTEVSVMYPSQKSRLNWADSLEGEEEGALARALIVKGGDKCLSRKGKVEIPHEKTRIPSCDVVSRPVGRRKKRRRLRSRNEVVDAWLEEEDGTDAYADLEDFIAPDEYT